MDFLIELIHNKPIIISVIAWAIAQIIKIIIDLITTKTIDLKLMFSSGGMPSSHSSFVCSLATSMGIIYGFNSPYFSMCFVLAVVVMYDAAGVRRAAGSQAAVINKVIDTFEMKIDEQLKELLGHTPIQVMVGAVLGIVISIAANVLM